ncbi:MAG: cytochrome c [Betaproteobacteria bacterium]|jgi:cytochrome c5|nr:cytochrome c [Betaproteobacteria bacterium]
MKATTAGFVACFAVLGATVAGATWADDSAEQAIAAARVRWQDSPHGPMLARILPPTFEAAQLPERHTRGAQLVVEYCVQCHNLPNPAMHDAAKWPGIVERMVVRMQGKGNLGTLMKEMMAGVKAPTDEERAQLLTYLQRYAQRPLDPRKYSDIESDAAKSFRLACQQCHVLPDPRRYTAAEWPAVVARMEKNMLWMNRVVGSKPNPDEPQLRIDEIIGYLQKHAR